MDTGINIWLVGGGLLSGLVMGVVIQRSNFCMAASVSNLVLMKDFRQLHAYLAAITVAIIGTQLLNYIGVISLLDTGYRTVNVDWFGAILGGTLFGFGSILSGGCIGRTVVRVGEGNLGALIVLVCIGVVGAATMYGELEPLRLWLREMTVVTMHSNDTSFSSLLSIPATMMAVLIAVLCCSIILLTGKKTRSPQLIIAGAMIGLLVVLGWCVTGYLSHDIFSTHRPTSITFSGPTVNLTQIAFAGSSLGVGTQFGLTLVAGTLLGAYLSAAFSKSFHWALPEFNHIWHLVVGGSLMGCGAVLAGGCNLGQGLTGISTFSIQSLIALVSIVVGMRVGLAYLLRTEKINSQRTESMIHRMVHRLIHH